MMVLQHCALWMIVGGLVAAASPVFAEDTGDAPRDPVQRTGRPPSAFERLDRNSDGTLTRDEVEEARGRWFERLLRTGDEDRDGTLSRDEFQAAFAKDRGQPAEPDADRGRDRGRRFDPQRMFRALDKNQDGKLTRDEIPERARERLGGLFDRLGKDELTAEDFRSLRRHGPDRAREPGAFFGRLDRDEDGKISKDEAENLPEPLRKNLQSILERTGKDEVTREEFARLMTRHADRERRQDADRGRSRGGRRGPFAGPRLFQLADADEDGRLSKEELGQIAEKFEELDVNNDGQLDPREVFGLSPSDGPRRGFFGRNRRDGRSDEQSRFDEDRPRSERRDRTDRDSRRRSRDRGRPSGDFFARFDRDDDGKISREEAPERMRRSFDRIDADGDGSIDRREAARIFERNRKRDSDSDR